MKTFVTMFYVALILAGPARVEADPPTLSSWLLNTTGVTGYAGISANVQLVRYSAGSAYISASGIPAYAIGAWPGDPNVPSNQSYVFRIPRSPTVNGGTKTATSLGPIGVWRNGVPVFNAKDAMSYNNQNIWHQNAVVVEASSFDACLGHPAPGGVYHHHQNPRCLYAADSTAHSPLLGYAFDGYPIYGPYGFANAEGSGPIARIRSSYRVRSITQRHTLPDGTVLSPSQYGPDVSVSYPLGTYIEDYEYAAGTGDLDQYNGRFAVTPEYPQGSYAYVATIGPTGASAYPYAVGPSYYGIVASDNVTQHGHVTVSEGVLTYAPLSIAPELLAPAPDTLIQSLGVAVRWRALAGAGWYRVQFAADTVFTSPVVDSTLADTAFLFVPPASGNWSWRVLAISGEASSPWSAVRSFSYAQPGVQQWAIISLPRIVADARASILFPSAVSAAFGYAPGAGYAPAETLRTGKGYWLKLPAGTPAGEDGDPVPADSIPVLAGWNLIGSIGSPIGVAAIGSDPPGLVTSQFFGYDKGYDAIDTISPGRGYWVLVSETGTLLLGPGAVPGAGIRVVATAERPPLPPGESLAEEVPRAMFLEQNYPNPFNPSTTIRFVVERDGWVQLRVYDLLGSEVATLTDGIERRGTHAASWDGTNARGESVHTGVYVCRYVTGDRTEMRKMLLVR